MNNVYIMTKLYSIYDVTLRLVDHLNLVGGGVQAHKSWSFPPHIARVVMHAE